MKILGIEHLAIAVENIDDSAPFWSHILKIPHRKTEVVKSEGVTTDIYDTGRGKVELLESLGEDSPINNFCLLYTSPSPRDRTRSRMPSSA